MNALFGLNTEIGGIGDNAIGSSTTKIQRLLKDNGFEPNKEGLRKALKDRIAGKASPAARGIQIGLENLFGGSYDAENPSSLGGGTSDGVGRVNYNDLIKSIDKYEDLEEGIIDEYGSMEKFEAKRAQTEKDIKTFEIGSRIQDEIFESQLSSNNKGTNMRNVNGNLAINWKATLTKEQLFDLFQRDKLSYDDIEHLVDEGVIEGKLDKQMFGTPGYLGFGIGDLESDTYKLNYASNEVYSEQVGETYTGAIHKNIGVTGTAKTTNARRLANDRAGYQQQNSIEAPRTDQLYQMGKTKALSRYKGSPKIHAELKKAFAETGTSDQLKAIRDIVHKYRIGYPTN